MGSLSHDFPPLSIPSPFPAPPYTSLGPVLFLLLPLISARQLWSEESPLVWIPSTYPFNKYLQGDLLECLVRGSSRDLKHMLRHWTCKLCRGLAFFFFFGSKDCSHLLSWKRACISRGTEWQLKVPITHNPSTWRPTANIFLSCISFFLKIFLKKKKARCGGACL